MPATASLLIPSFSYPGKHSGPLLWLIVFSPIVLLLKPEHFSNFPIAQWRFPFTHLSRDRRVRTCFLQEFLRRHCSGDCVICRVEHLKAEPIFLHAKIAYLTQVSGIDIRPRIPLPAARIFDIIWEIALVLMRLDHVTDSQGVDIGAKSPGETSRTSLSA